MSKGIPSLVRMEIHDFRTGEHKECHSNPDEVEEVVSVLWSKKQPVGMSSARLHYGGTDNRGYSLTLYLDADKVAPEPGWTELVSQSLGSSGPATSSGGGGAAAIMDWRRYLMSFCYPPRRDDGRLDDPSDMLLIWPGFMTIRAKADSVRFRYRRWVAGSEINIFTADLRLLSVGDVLVTAQDARTEGAERVEFIFG